MRESTVFDCLNIDLKQIKTLRGGITSVEKTNDFLFDFKRVYYLYDIPGGEDRGGHAHKDLQQVIVAVSGSFDLIVDDGKAKKTFTLNSPSKAVQMPSGLWRKLVNFSSGSVCLVLCSDIYDEKDYLRNYQDFLSFKLINQ